MASSDPLDSEVPPVAASAVSAYPAVSLNDDARETRKLIVLEQLTTTYGFSTEAAEKAIEEVGPELPLALKFILENGLGKDQGGTVTLKQDCPHVTRHVKITPDGLPGLPQNALCSYFEDHQINAEEEDNNALVGQPKNDYTEEERGRGEGRHNNNNNNTNKCPTDENWLCLECGAVRCSRYGNAHCVAHWEETKGADSEGHCVAASLADLSVWCQECDSYILHPTLDPILQKLEKLKFEEVDMQPAKKKLRPSTDNLVELEGAEALEEEEDSDDSGNDSDSAVSASILQIAAAVARGVPIDLFQEESEDEEDIEYPFGTLPTSLEGVANFILSDQCRNIVILAGAGMSTPAGIPDFRSADGLYATMDPDKLTANPVEREAIHMDPTVALEQGMFLQNPFPCLELQREFILGTHNQRWKATLAHRFIELLHSKTGKLVRLYTQNIDGLEDQCTGLPKEKRIAVHGSMDRAECARCGEEQDYDEFCEKVQKQIKDLSGKDESAPRESTPIECPICGYNAMKPAIVLFRSSLPKEFFEKVPQDILDADMLIVMGTSLRVAPANSLVWRVPKKAMRLLVNREPVGWHLGVQYGDESKRDFFAPGDCDSVLLELMAHLGWLEDLQPLLDGDEPKLPDSSAALLRVRLDQDPGEEQQLNGTP